MTAPLADQLTALALLIERGDISDSAAGLKLRDIAEKVRALEAREQARLSDCVAGRHGIAHGRSPYVEHVVHQPHASLADSAYARSPHVAGPEAEAYGEQQED